MSSLIRTNIYLSKQQPEGLRRVSKELGGTVAEYVRRAIDVFLRSFEEDMRRAERKLDRRRKRPPKGYVREDSAVRESEHNQQWPVTGDAGAGVARLRGSARMDGRWTIHRCWKFGRKGLSTPIKPAHG